jgi:arylsulfatase A-like enzyme
MRATAARAAGALYDGRDARFTRPPSSGRLLDAIDAEGTAARTLVVVTADHGEGLMQHGHMGHGLHLTRRPLHVPLVFRWPGSLPAGSVVPGPWST